MWQEIMAMSHSLLLLAVSIVACFFIVWLVIVLLALAASVVFAIFAVVAEFSAHIARKNKGKSNV